MGRLPRTRPPRQETEETWVGSLGGEDPLEEGVATHPGIPAGRAPWTEEPGGLQSMRSQSQTRPKRLSTKVSLHTPPLYMTSHTLYL